jgi:hypothetical protein
MTIKPLKILTLLLILAAGLVYLHATLAMDYIDNGKNLGWRQLEYRASKFFLTAESTVTLDKKPAAEVIDKLVTSDKHDVLLPQGDSVFIVTTDTDNFGTRTRYTMWFDGNATILQRLKVRTGDDNDVSVNRYTADGYLDYWKKFSNKKFSVNLPNVKGYSHRYEAYPDTGKLNGHISESAAFLYLVSMLKLQEVGDSAQFTVYTHGKLTNVILKVKGRQKLDVDYELVSQRHGRQIEGERETLKIAIVPVDASGKRVKDFKLMGVKGRLYMYLDVKDRLLLQISGDAKVLGRVNIKLRKAIKAD